MKLNLLILPKINFLSVLEQNLERITQVLFYVEPVVSEFVDTTTGTVSKYLPPGESQQIKQYHFVKTDSSINTVIIYPYGSQLIMATTSLVLVNQGDSAHLAFDKVSQTWWLI